MLQEGFPGQRTPPSRQGGSRLRGLLSRERDDMVPGGIRLSNLRFNNELSRKSKRSLQTKVSVKNLNEHSRSSRKSQNDKTSQLRIIESRSIVSGGSGSAVNSLVLNATNVNIQILIR